MKRSLALTLAIVALSLVAALCGSVPLLEDLDEAVPAAEAHPYGYLPHCSQIHNTQGPGSYSCHNDANTYNITSHWLGNCMTLSNGQEQCATATTSCSSQNSRADCPKPSDNAVWRLHQSIRTLVTTAEVTTVVIPNCVAETHSHTVNPHGAGNSNLCHGHSCSWFTSGVYITGHASWLTTSRCSPTTTTTTTTLPSSCATGLHSHTGDGRNCHTHNFVPNTCGASYQVINGTGHDTRFVRTVPPCTIGTGTTTTTTTAVLTCATLIEEQVEASGDLRVIIGTLNGVQMPTGTRWKRDMWVEAVSNGERQGTVSDLVPRGCPTVHNGITYRWSSPDVDPDIWATDSALGTRRGWTQVWFLPRTVGPHVVTIEVSIDVAFADGSTTTLAVQSWTITGIEEQTL